MRILKNTRANRYEEGNGCTENRVGYTSLNKKGRIEGAKKGRARAKRGDQQYQRQDSAIDIVNDRDVVYLAWILCGSFVHSFRYNCNLSGHYTNKYNQ